jgi:hypothetical protein
LTICSDRPGHEREEKLERVHDAWLIGS